MKIFISGTAGFGGTALSELPESVKNYINGCVAQKNQILIGDCMGIDTLVQHYLNDIGYDNVHVYCSGSTCRNKINKNWTVVNVIVPPGTYGRDFFAVKDIAMARDADTAFAIWDGKSKGTGANITNMQQQNKPVTIFRIDKNYFESYINRKPADFKRRVWG